MLVFASLLERKCGIVLHADVENITRVANNAPEEARDGRHGYEGEEGGLRIGRGETVLKSFVDTEPGHAIGQLAQLRGR